MMVADTKTLRTATLFAAALVLSACGDGELETVTIVEGICTLESRLAILVTLNNPDDLAIDSVTATRTGEQQCFLETRQRWLAEDAGEPEGLLYSCWEQGTGTYVVRVKSGRRTWSESVEVSGNECHITSMQKLTFELE